MSQTDASTTAHPLKRTPLYDLHLKLGARMVPFAGYEMPLQYTAGILKEHLHTRASAGLFDVSHMGQIIVRPRSGVLADAARALEQLIPADILGLAPARQKYGLFTNAAGGILDDLMISNRADHYLLIVNAARKDADEAHLGTHLAQICEVKRSHRALLALQGPESETVLASLAPACAAMRFMDVREMIVAGAPCIVARSGYTGEDGFEISVPEEAATGVAEALLSHADVAPIGLGARDSLRLEAGLPLYGSDLDEATTPVEADLSWAISKSRRAGGLRSGGFPGAEIILGQIANGAPRLRAGLRPQGRQPVREGVQLFADAEGQQPAGAVTSGGFGPGIQAPVSMGYLATPFAAPGTKLFAEVRGKYIPLETVTLPFVAHRYKRD